MTLREKIESLPKQERYEIKEYRSGWEILDQDAGLLAQIWFNGNDEYYTVDRTEEYHGDYMHSVSLFHLYRLVDFVFSILEGTEEYEKRKRECFQEED